MAEGENISMTNLFEKNILKEEKLFLSLCSLKDKQKLLQQIPMSFNDYLRISCILYAMNLLYYKIRINELFPEFFKMEEEMLKRHNKILKEYPDYYEDENIDEKVQNWLIEFYSQLSNKHQQKKYAKMFHLE